ncbi:MAG: MBL fold metallo-hydrolase [Bacillota bacterium]
MTVEGKVIAYTGDTAWTDTLIEASWRADLLIADAYTIDRELKNHLSHAVLTARKERLGASKIVLTHLGPETLARLEEVEFPVAADGAEFDVG